LRFRLILRLRFLLWDFYHKGQYEEALQGYI